VKDFSNSYLNILKTDFKDLNLTRILNDQDFYIKQILDSTVISKYNMFTESIKSSEVIVDVGFGGGFPILPLAKLYPEKFFIGLEAKRKKVDAVSLIAEKLNINNVKLVHERVENINFNIKTTLVSKAVCSLHKMYHYINNGHRVNIFMYKGPNFRENELSELKKIKFEEWDTQIIDNVDRKIIYAIKHPKNMKQNGLKKISDLLP